MKKFTYITVFLVGLIFVSCGKQEILPANNNDSSDLPEWRSSGVSTSGVVGGGTEGTSITDPDDKEGGVDVDVFGGTLVDFDGNAITDPSDKDGSGKGKKRGK